MKYTTSDNTTWRPNVGTIPKPWLTSNLDIHERVIWEYLRENVIPYDADVCDDGEIIFLFEGDMAFKVHWSFWIDYDPDFEIKHEWHMEEMELSDVPSMMRKERDWI